MSSATLQNYTDGQITIYGEICYESWLLLPGQLLWSKYALGAFYVCAILYLFLGIAICADMFMLSIEMITSKKRVIFMYDRDTNQRVESEVFVWNETIANLTLMALGSSAPEILISVFETLASLSDTEPTESLGLFTIIGSAAYNMIVITAICVMAVPKGTFKRVNEFGVFLVTSFWSIFAYVWLIFVVRWSSANEIELWEAILTLLFFPLLVISAWMQDKGCWLHKCRRHKLNKHITELHRIEQSNGTTAVDVTFHHKNNNEIEMEQPSFSPSHKIRLIVQIYVSVYISLEQGYSDIKLRKVTALHEQDTINTKRERSSLENKSITCTKAFARARFRHAVVLSITGKTKTAEDYENSLKQRISKQQQHQHHKSHDSKPHGNGKLKQQLLDFTDDSTSGNFCFSSSSYSVSRTSEYLKVNVLLNRRKKNNEKIIGFSHVVDVARKSKGWVNLQQSINGQTNQNGTSCNHSNNNHSKIQHSYHIPVSIRNSLPEVEVEESNEVSVIQNENAVNSREKYSVNRSTDDMRNSQTTSSSKTLLQPDATYSRESSLIDLKKSTVVSYETREGKAKYDKDFVQCSGTLVFNDSEFSKTIEIKLSGGEQNKSPSKQNEHNGGEGVDFFIVLKDPCHDAVLGDPSIAHVSIIDDNDPGEFIFQDATAFVQYKLFNVSIVTASVVRLHGSDGASSVYYRTINGTAFGGDDEDMRDGKCDFERIEEGELKFSSGETSKKIMIKTNPEADKSRTFIIALYHSTGNAKIGHRCATIVSLSSEVDEIVEQVTSITDDNNNKLPLTNKQEYRKQFKEAMCLDEEPSISDMFLHVLCFAWKIIFALIPPRTVWGGWATFVVSLLMLGVLAALVEQYSKLLGCIVGLHVSVTGITLVALGTSMPDTFASKTAALQDDSADAAIGNITGSNSVNVFLGLGLPWVIKSAYLKTKGGGASISLQADELMFSVLVFLLCGLITLSILVVRRVLEGGELGGSSTSKYFSGCSMICLWFVFVTCTALQAYGVISVDLL